jgi:hypothetical protein
MSTTIIDDDLDSDFKRNDKIFGYDINTIMSALDYAKASLPSQAKLFLGSSRTEKTENNPEQTIKVEQLQVPNDDSDHDDQNDHEDDDAYPVALPSNRAQFLAELQLGAHLSSAVYCSQPDYCRNFPVQLIGNVSDVQRDLIGAKQIGVLVTFDKKNNVIRVIFRGTSSASQWMGNAEMNSYQCGNDFGKAHSGFVSMYLGTRQDVWNGINECIKKYPHNKGIQFTGHSLGGALAMLATCDFKYGINLLSIDGNQYATSDLFPFNPQIELVPSPLRESIRSRISGASSKKFNCPPILVLYTYGQPRVGNGRFARSANKLLGENNYYRVSHGKDMVCSLPPAAFGFRSAGISVHFASGSSTKYKIRGRRNFTDQMTEFVDGGLAMLQDSLIGVWGSMPSIAAAESVPNNADRVSNLSDILLPAVADHMYYVGVNFDNILHRNDCTLEGYQARLASQQAKEPDAASWWGWCSIM